MRKFKNVAQVEPSKGRVMGGPRIVVPDDAMTPKEIMLRFAQGRPVPIFNPSYSDEDLPDLKAMDLTEIQEMQDDLNQTIKDLNAEIERRSKPNDDSNDDRQKGALESVNPD